MTLEPDVLADRRRLKRQITMWRLVGVFGVVAAVLLALAGSGAGLGPERRDHIALVSVDGLIFDNRDLIEAIAEAAHSRRAKAILVRINSPGGTTVGGESLYVALRAAAEENPVVAVIGTVGASAGYMVALAADHIIARETSVTGSIGVLLETAEISGLLEMLGITAETIRSAPLKGTPSLFEPLTEETRAATQSVVDDIYEWFVALFADRRGLELDSARGLADGRIFTGRQALALGMIDATGGEEDAIVWLEQSRGIETDLPVIDIQPEIDHGITEFLTSLGQKTLLSERLRLDGLLSVWQPDR